MTIEENPQDSNAMQQTNQGNAKGWQTRVEGGTAYIAETIHISSVDAGVSQSTKRVDFQPYLRSMIADEKYQQKWGFYTSTDAIGKLQKPKSSSELDVGLMVQLMKPRRSAEDRNPEPEKQEETERLPVLEGIRKYAAEHVLLMGRPGSGKTTALFRLLIDEAKQALEDPSTKIPVLVELRYLDAERPSILERIRAFLRSHDLSVEEATLNAALVEGKLLLLIDGVNELPSEAARRAIARFRQDYPKTSMVFTTRDVAIGGDVGIEKKLEMQPLDELQMRQFVQTYLPEQGEPMLRQLQGRLREIGQTPLLLWMLCEVFKGLQQLPSSLGLLFRWFTGEYDKLKQDVPVSEGLRYWQAELLQHLALTMMQAEEPTELRVAIPRQEAETVLADFLRGKVDYPTQRAKEWLEDLLEFHLLQRTSQNELEFHHQLLQEYYAAEALLRRLPQLSDEQLKRDYLNYLKWTEPLALMLALDNQAAQVLRVVKLAIETDLFLGARLAGEVKSELQDKAVDMLLATKGSAFLKVKLLGLTRSDSAISFLERNLNQKNLDVAKLAIQALFQIGSELSIFTLLKAFQSSQLEIRQVAAQVIRETNSPFAIPTLIQVITDKNEDSTVRVHAICALGKIGDPSIAPTLIEIISKDKDVNLRINAVSVLEEILGEKASPYLEKALRDEDHFVSWAASIQLNKMDKNIAKSILQKALLSDNPWTRMNVASVLSECCDREIERSLVEAVQRELLFTDKHGNSLYKNTFINVFPSLIRALGGCRGSEIENSLLEFSRHENPNICMAAIQALGKLGGSFALLRFQEIVEERNENNYFLFSVAVEALGEVGGESVLPILQYLLSDERSWVREGAVSGLEKIQGSSEAISALRMALKDEHEIVRRRAAIAFDNIASFRDSECVVGVDYLIGLLRDKNPETRFHAAQALWRIGDTSKAVDSLISMLAEEEQSNIRMTAARALGRANVHINAEVIESLISALGDSDLAVRICAAEALGEISGPEVIPILQSLSLELSENYLDSAIAAIQSRCKFYNHEIAHGLLPSGKSIALYFSYAQNDEDLRNELENHLSILKREGVITSWDKRQILPGDEPEYVINARLNTADIILLLISPDSLADNTCYDVEIRRAMERHQAGKARVIPILLRPVDWAGALFGQLPILPHKDRPVTTWENRDQAFQSIVAGIREMAIELRRMKG